MAKRIPPQVTLQGVRLSMGLTGAQLAEQIYERTGVTVSPKTLFNIENGEQGVSNEVLAAWCTVLKLNPRDVRHDADIRELVAQADAKAAERAAAQDAAA
jgi:transcriptional regulator with XRE-family HTH domain